MSDPALFQVDELACIVGYRPLFSGLHLQLSPGQWIELTGPNGTGKTTLLRTLAGLSRPVAGQLLWQGQRVTPTSTAWRGRLAYQGHAAALKDGLSCAGNLATWLALDLGERPDKALTAHWLDIAGIAPCAELPAASLSAGQRRRVQLARLAASAGRLLWLLDEPGNALDSSGLSLFNRLLGKHLDDGGIAIVATHQQLSPGPVAQELFMPTFGRPAVNHA